MCAPLPGGPTDRFRIAPTLMADGDAEGQRTRFGRRALLGTGRVGGFLGGIELDFVLETSELRRG